MGEWVGWCCRLMRGWVCGLSDGGGEADGGSNKNSNLHLPPLWNPCWNHCTARPRPYPSSSIIFSYFLYVLYVTRLCTIIHEFRKFISLTSLSETIISPLLQEVMGNLIVCSAFKKYVA